MAIKNWFPNYVYLRLLFRNLFRRKGYEYDYIFDWTEIKFLEHLERRKRSEDGIDDSQHLTPVCCSLPSKSNNINLFGDLFELGSAINSGNFEGTHRLGMHGYNSHPALSSLARPIPSPPARTTSPDATIPLSMTLSLLATGPYVSSAQLPSSSTPRSS